MLKFQHSRRYDFDWSVLSNTKEVRAEVTLNRWVIGQVAGISVPIKVKFILKAGKGFTGMHGIDGEAIPEMIKEHRTWLHAMARAYYETSFGKGKHSVWMNPDT